MAACLHAPAPCWSWPCWRRSPPRSSSARRLSPPTRSTARRPRQAAPTPREGVPPFELALGVRDDAEATDLRRAAALYSPRGSGSRPRRSSRATTRSRRSSAPPSPPGRRARTGSSSSAPSIREARSCSSTSGCPASGPGTSGALTAWREARDVEPDTPYAVRAGDFIHARDFAPGLPGFVVSFDYRIEGKTPAEQLHRLAADRTLRGRLLYGIALQGLGRPVSARRAFAEARELAPNNVDALVADAVGRYDKGNPSASFSRLGPLSRRFPHAATVRFHLGVLLLWQKNVKEAIRQLELARKAEPGSKIAAEAKRFLDAVRNAGTS